MVEQIIAKLENLKMIHNLYLNNALSDGEYQRYKIEFIGSLGSGREAIRIEDLKTVLILMRSLYEDKVLNRQDWSDSRHGVLSHVRSATSNLDAFILAYRFYGEGLFSIEDFHNIKKSLLIVDADENRIIPVGRINRIRHTFVPFVAGQTHFTPPAGSTSTIGSGTINSGGTGVYIDYTELQEGEWENPSYPGIIKDDSEINSLLSQYGGYVDWGTVQLSVSVTEVIRERIAMDTYSEREILHEAYGLTDAELRDSIADLTNPLVGDSEELLGIFDVLVSLFEA